MRRAEHPGACRFFFTENHIFRRLLLPKRGMDRAQIGIVQPSAYLLEPMLIVRRTIGILSNGYVLMYVSTHCLEIWVLCHK